MPMHNHKQHQKQTPFHSTPIKTPEEWKSHWKAQGQEWRTEPEISPQRQTELTQCRALKPNEEKGIYPFGRVKLDRADIEWLLATHENGRGPIIWSDESQRERTGLDLRGADLRGDGTQKLNLKELPLSRVIGGFLGLCRVQTQGEQAAIHLEGANLFGAYLEGANLFGAHFEGADLSSAHFEGANLLSAHLERADLSHAHFEGVSLSYTHFEGADLSHAHLEGVSLWYAHFEGANLFDAHFEGADLSHAHLEGADLAHIHFADTHHIGPRIADAQWGDTNLAIVDWSLVTLLGDEYQARQRYDEAEGQRKDKDTRIEEYKDAARANRQLSVMLQSQGLNEDATRFAYRAQALQKAVLWFRLIQDNTPFRTRLSLLGSWLFSWFMFLIAGYGYRFGRTFLTYLTAISGFATLYYLYGISDVDAHGKPGPHHLSFYEAVVVSLTAFHGRGFFVGTFSPGDPQALVAAFEAFVGLLIEVIFIATLTRRLFTQ